MDSFYSPMKRKKSFYGVIHTAYFRYAFWVEINYTLVAEEICDSFKQVFIIVPFIIPTGPSHQFVVKADVSHCAGGVVITQLKTFQPQLPLYTSHF